MRQGETGEIEANSVFKQDLIMLSISQYSMFESYWWGKFDPILKQSYVSLVNFSCQLLADNSGSHVDLTSISRQCPTSTSPPMGLSAAQSGSLRNNWGKHKVQ
jgi:hypothetical protein